MNGENADGVEREHHVRYEVEWGFRGGMMGSNSDFGSDSFCAKTAAGGHQRAFTGLSGVINGIGITTITPQLFSEMASRRFRECTRAGTVLVVCRYKYLLFSGTSTCLYFALLLLPSMSQLEVFEFQLCRLEVCTVLYHDLAPTI